MFPDFKGAGKAAKIVYFYISLNWGPLLQMVSDNKFFSVGVQSTKNKKDNVRNVLNDLQKFKSNARETWCVILISLQKREFSRLR